MGHDRTLDDRTKMLGAFGKAQRQKTASQGVHQTVAGSAQRLGRLDPIVQNVIGYILQDTVVIGADIEIDGGGHAGFSGNGWEKA